MEIEQLKNKTIAFLRKHEKDKEYTLDMDTAFIHLTEEVGEVAQELVNKKLRKDRYNEESFKEEIADVFVEAFILAEMAGIKDIGKAIDEKLNTLYERYGYEA